MNQEDMISVCQSRCSKDLRPVHRIPMLFFQLLQLISVILSNSEIVFAQNNMTSNAPMFETYGP